MTPRPIFVVGSPRSGTSALTWSLGQHPNILPIEESNWIAKFAIDLGSTYTLGVSRGSRSNLSSMGVTPEAFYEHFGQAIDHLLRGHRAQFEQLNNLHGRNDPAGVHEAFKLFRATEDRKSRWVDGTPEYSFGILGLLKLFPEARFIHILRDVENVVRSMMTFSSADGGRLVQTEEAAYDYWLRAVEACVAAERALGSATVLRVRHADLLQDPEQVLRQCFDFVGEGFCAESLPPLRVRINSSTAAAEYVLGQGNPDHRMVTRARRLSCNLLTEDEPRNTPDRRRMLRAEKSFAERVQFVGALDEERLAALAALSKTEQALETLRAWARIQQVREVVRWSIPLGSIVLMVTTAKHELLLLDGRTAWQFPRAWRRNARRGPAHEAAVLAELDALVAYGAEYLVVPSAAFDWLAHQAGLLDVLKEKHLRIATDDACVVYRLVATSRAEDNHHTPMRAASKRRHSRAPSRTPTMTPRANSSASETALPG